MRETDEQRRMRYTRNYQYLAGAAEFWGKCIRMLDAGQTYELRAEMTNRLAQRIKDCEQVKAKLDALKVAA